MKSYLALINVTLKLAMRERSVLFFNYLFPLIFFFAFGQFMGAKAGGTLTRVISMVLVIGVLGSGLFGAGMRTVAEREANILRRYKVTPISPLPILVANIISGWVLYIPAVLLILGLSHFIYGMSWPANTGSLLLLVSVGIPAEGIGLILGIDRFLDMCRTTLNVSGDLVMAALVAGRRRAPQEPPDHQGRHIP